MYEFAVTRVRSSITAETKYMYTGVRNPNLSQYNQMIYDAFGIPNRTDTFVIANTYTANKVEQFVIRDAKYA